MRKFKNVLILLLTLAICVMCFAACGGTQKPETSGPQNGTATTGPGTGSVENPPESPSNDPEDNDGTPSEPTDPDDGDEKAEDPIDSDNGDEKTEEPQQPITPQDPVQPENPDDPDGGDDNGENKNEPTKPDPDKPTEPEDPDPPQEPILPEKLTLAEGDIALIENSDTVFAFIAQESGYYVVKIAGESARGTLYLDGAAVAGTDGEFYLCPVLLEEGQTIDLSVEICGGEIGVFKAAELEQNDFGEYTATSSNGQNYFVYIAESEGEFTFDLMLEDETSIIGKYYLANGIYFGDTIYTCHDCNLKQGEIIVVWVQNANITITVW